MESSVDYRITKLEKGPLQRFKNQNLLIKKFGETGLQVYKAAGGKRTAEQLRGDLDMEPEMFAQILDYMREMGMVELTTVGVEAGKGKDEEEGPGPEAAQAEDAESQSGEAARPQAGEEAIEPLEESGEIQPIEEDARPRRKKAVEGEESGDEIRPEGGGNEETAGGENEGEGGGREEGIADAKEEEQERGKETRGEVTSGETEEGEAGGGEEEAGEETTGAETPEEESYAETARVKPEEPLAMEEEDAAGGSKDARAGLSPVELIIRDKYGEVGLKVYTLIDGHRTAEQIMKETGLSEAKLVEILDFMDEQGIIKLEYPREKKGAGGGGAPGAAGGEAAAEGMPEAIGKEEFSPMIEKEEAEDELKASGVELPVKAPMDLVKGVQLKARVMLKLGDRGGKLLEQIDGRQDVVELALKLNIPLYEADRMIRFLVGEHAIIIKPTSRADVKKKYGDDGYAVYKRYGKEGLMLYELIGKEMTIREMADRVSTDRARVADMFLFIHKVLGIDLPIDKEVLAKQFGIDA